MKRIASVCLFLLLASSLLSARPFALDAKTDGLLAGGGVALLSTDLLLEHGWLEKDDRADHYFTYGPYDKDDVPAFDRSLMHRYAHGPSTASEVTQVLSLAMPAVLFATGKDDLGTWTAMYGESLLLAYGLKELGKNLVDRKRPYLYYGNAEDSDHLDDGDWDKSFPSGHATMSFCAATFASYTFATYYPDSRWKWPVIATSYALAATTAALRVAGGNHFASDVLAGAAIGAFSGWIVPFLHRQREEKKADVTVLPGMVMASMTF